VQQWGKSDFDPVRFWYITGMDGVGVFEFTLDISCPTFSTLKLLHWYPSDN